MQDKRKYIGKKTATVSWFWMMRLGVFVNFIWIYCLFVCLFACSHCIMDERCALNCVWNALFEFSTLPHLNKCVRLKSNVAWLVLMQTIDSVVINAMIKILLYDCWNSSHLTWFNSYFTNFGTNRVYNILVNI